MVGNVPSHSEGHLGEQPKLFSPQRVGGVRRRGRGRSRRKKRRRRKRRRRRRRRRRRTTSSDTIRSRQLYSIQLTYYPLEKSNMQTLPSKAAERA